MSSFGTANREAWEELKSPGLGVGPGKGRAYELKFHLSADEAVLIESWARQNLAPDFHGQDGHYQITSVYCDTPYLDVFHRTPGFRRSKFRLRRYGEATGIFLERKSKRKDRVHKKRVEVLHEELNLLAHEVPPVEWVGAWFQKHLVRRKLTPICLVTYARTAFFGRAEFGTIRLTLDRDLRGTSVEGWNVPKLDGGQSLLPDGVLLELKFHEQMPEMFKELLAQLPPQPAKMSKYRLCVHQCGLKGLQKECNSDAAVSYNHIESGAISPTGS